MCYSSLEFDVESCHESGSRHGESIVDLIFGVGDVVDLGEKRHWYKAGDVKVVGRAQVEKRIVLFRLFGLERPDA